MIETCFRARSLTRQAFAPFGAAMNVGEASGRTVDAGRVDICATDLAPIECAPDCALAWDFYRVRPSATPLRVMRLERHPFSAQSFAPMRASRYVLFVARGEDAPDLSSAACFIADGNDAVTYARGVWHLSITALDSDAAFVSLMGRRAEGNTEFLDLSAPILLEVDP